MLILLLITLCKVREKGGLLIFLFALKYSEADFTFLADQDDIWHINKVGEFAKIAKQKNNDYSSDSSLVTRV